MSKIEITNFIQKSLKDFIKSFPKTRVRYEFDSDADVHCIEVVPNTIHHLDSACIEWERNFIDEFLKRFPYEHIYFFSDDAIIGITHCQFELVGNEYVIDIVTNDINPSVNVEDKDIHFSNSLHIDILNSTNEIINNRLIVSKFNQSNLSIDEVTSLSSSLKNEKPVLFSINYSMVA